MAGASFGVARTTETSAGGAARGAVRMGDVHIELVPAARTVTRADARNQLGRLVRRPELNNLPQTSVPPGCLTGGRTGAGQRAQPSPGQSDETLGVGLLVAAGLLETRHRRIVERVRRLAARDRDCALVQLEARGTGHIALRFIDQRLYRLTLRRKPVPVVHHFSVARNQ